MAQDELTTPQQLFGILVPTLLPFSLTRHIGGKLCALYEDDGQPSPPRTTELLDALDRDVFVGPGFLP